MKKKILICTLCFTIFFTSLNINKSYADGGVISLPLLATVSALAVGTGIVINNDDDLYDLGRLFYDWVDSHNTLTWQTVTTAFAAATTLVGNKVSVDSKFLDVVKEFFDTAFSSNNNIIVDGIPLEHYEIVTPNLDKTFTSNGVSIRLRYSGDGYATISVTLPDGHRESRSYGGSSSVHKIGFKILSANYIGCRFSYDYAPDSIREPDKIYSPNNDFASVSSITFPYTGGYTWDNLNSKKENDKVALPIPQNLGNLVGQNANDFWDNANNLVGNNDISIPTTSNPSISLDNTTSFPNTNIDTDNPSIPDTDNPNNGLEIFPPWGGGIDFTPVTQSSFIDKFPFSLGNDIKNILNVFDVDPIAPKFKVPIVSETIELDLTEFEQLASIIRFFVLVGFIISLILITRSVIG